MDFEAQGSNSKVPALMENAWKRYPNNDYYTQCERRQGFRLPQKRSYRETQMLVLSSPETKGKSIGKPHLRKVPLWADGE